MEGPEILKCYSKDGNFLCKEIHPWGNPPQYATVANKGGKFPDHPPIEQRTGCLVVSKIPKMQRVTSPGVVESNRVREELATQQRK
jgi:hypothetical protein